MNKPVAYLHKDGSLIKVDQRYEVIDPDFIPLYTHPVKELTDEEIENWALNFVHDDDELDIYGFAKAILRKAQEK